MTAKLIKGTEIREQILEEITAECSGNKRKPRGGARTCNYTDR
jgi:hypothetical protein